MLYRYRAIDAAGQRIGGRLEAGNPLDLEMRLKHMALELIDCRPVNRHHPLFFGSMPRPELINFCFHVEQLTRAGVPLLDGLHDLRDSLEPGRLRESVGGLIEGINGGQTLAQAMAAQAGTFTPVCVNLIAAGESCGQLPETLNSLGESLRWEDELAAHSKKLLIYPSLVAGIVLVTTLFLMLYLVPQLKPFVQSMGQTLPLQTQALFRISDLLAKYWQLLLFTPVLPALAWQAIRHSNPLAGLHLDRLKLRLPVLGNIIKKIILARFANTFALLYAAGIPILDALRTTQNIVGNRALRQALEEAEQNIRDGRNVAGAFLDTGIFPPLVIRMLRVGENTGRLDNALLNVSYFYNRDVREAVGKAQAMIEPLLTVVMGLLLGWIMLAVIAPIYDVISRIRP